ncbi:MAG: AAA family ATPase, partial [Kiritimatiellae bacterium]|nr:AAA family ATPase [Kiritimatiellia bacterium]
MLWMICKKRARQLRDIGGSAIPLVSEIMSLWVEEDHAVFEALTEKAVERDALVGSLAQLEYAHQLDYPVHEALQSLLTPVTVGSVLSMMTQRFEKHPVVQLLAATFQCATSQLAGALHLQAAAAVATTVIQNSVLASLTTDLSAAAERGEFADLVPGPATQALEQALLKARRGSVIVTGPQGAGKTVSVQALAHRIARNEVHPRLRQCRILELSVGTLTAGTQFRGQFSERLEGILKELKDQGQRTILFIDEIHTVLGAGRVHGDSYDMGNALKAALAGRNLLVIGATTDTEYERYVTKDPAFARRFQRVRLAPLTGDALREVVLTQVAGLTEKHCVTIDAALWREALVLSDLYLSNRAAQPDRVLDLLDTACTLAEQTGSLSRTHLLRALSQTTGVPLDLLENGLCARLDRARLFLNERVFGQEAVVDAILARLEGNPLRLNADTRPLASFLILGGSGVGKTLLAEVLAEALFGGSEAFLLIHCGAFGEGGLAKLIGVALPGMDTQSEGALLPEFLRSHPFGIILFDELEKAYGTLWDLLLSLLDKGEFQGGDGRTYSVRHCVIICTSNAVTAQDLASPGIGFSSIAAPT